MIKKEFEINCQGCGSSLFDSIGMQQIKCQYCGKITKIPNKDLEIFLKEPDFILPFAVDLKNVFNSLYKHMASGKYTPDDLIKNAILSIPERSYFPAYIFYIKFQAHWTASFGYDRTETYTTYEKDSDGINRPVTQSRTVTDWRPANGIDSGNCTVISYAGKILDQSQLDVRKIIERCTELKDIKNYDQFYCEGIEVENFTRGVDDAFNLAESKINAIIDESVRYHGQGDQQRDWYWTANIIQKNKGLLIPLFHITYQYNKKIYNAWIHGADVSNMITDKRPEDHSRKKKVLIGFIPSIIFLIVIILLESHLSDSAKSFNLYLFVCFLFYGFWRRHKIISRSVRIRQSILAKKIASPVNIESFQK